MKELKVLALIIMVSAFSFSQSINVTFQVDMSMQVFEGNFPAGANVVVRGSFQADFGDTGGNWQGNLYQLSDPDDDTVYTGTFNAPASLAGNNYIFKYVIVNPPAGDNWESTHDRQFTITSPATILPIVYFNNDSILIPEFEVVNTLNFTADISGILGVGLGGAFDSSQDSLLVMGLDWDNLGKNVAGNRRMINTDPFNSGIYKTTLTVTSGSAAPNGVGDSTRWKFKAFPDARFANGGWETGSDRRHIYQADGSVIDLPFIVPRILPLFGVSTNPIDFTLNVDITGAVNIYNGEPIPLDSIEFVIVTGSAPFLGIYNSPPWPPYPCGCIDDTAAGYIKALTHTVGNIWSYHTIIPIGQPCGIIGYKFGAIYPGYDTINSGIGSLMNELPFGVNHNLMLTGLQSIIVINDLFGHPLPPDNVERIDNIIPSGYNLEQNYPNPFNPTTKIRYSIPSVGTRHALSVQIKVYDVLGREVATLVDDEQPAGVYEAAFDATQLTSGVYFYTLSTSNFSFTKKMILMR
jgi:hypothetical protein